MIEYVLIGLWTLFSWYVMKYKLFGMWVGSKGAEKARFDLKMVQKGQMRAFHIPIYLDLNRRGSREGDNHTLIKWAQNFWLTSS